MGQKINPIGYRLAVKRNWTSVWFARGAKFRQQVLADARARESIRKDFAQAMVSKIEIRRHPGVVRIVIHTARPGMVIGKKGEDIEKLREKLKRVFGENEIRLDIEEIRQPEVNAQLIAMNITSQLEKRVAFRRAVRRAVSSATRLGVQGIKIICSGRLNGAEIARTERYSEGRVPLHTLRAEIEYGFSAAHTTMGTVGVKVWVFKGEVYKRARSAPKAAEIEPLGDEADPGAEAKQESVVPSPEQEVPASVAADAVEAEKPAAKKPAPKKVVAKKPAAKKPPAKKPAAKEAATKKPAAKKVVAKKPAAKKAAVKKPAAKEAATKKPAAKKAVAKKPAAKDVPAKKPAAKKAAAKKPAAKKPASKE